MPDLNAREWAAILPLLILMFWMGSFSQSFLPSISVQNAAILESAKRAKVATAVVAQEVNRAR
jgi:NADH:ubiquinone oxidoreductase subunit 4 (subunit M)